MLIHLRKFSSKSLEGGSDSSQEIRFIGPAPILARPDLLESFDSDDSSSHDLESTAGSSIYSHSLSVSLGVSTTFMRPLRPIFRIVVRMWLALLPLV